MKFAIVGNPEVKKSIDVVKEVYDYLALKDEDVVIEAETAKKLNKKGVSMSGIDVGIIITVGGDGTVLRTIQKAKGSVFSINVGKLGFLTETIPLDLEATLDRLLSGNYHVDKKMKLKIEVNGKRLNDCTNEAVIHTAEIAKIRSYAIYVNNELVEDLRADGVIVATPTGSTSYALSAGGPIVDQRIKAFVITHIAPFKLGIRSHVVPSNSKIEIHLLDLRKKSVLVFDGQNSVMLKEKDRIVMTESENTADFIRFSTDYYRKFREKMI